MQLLVSPSSIDEARRSGAADIIDVKKPSEGSLGANYPWVILVPRRAKVTEIFHLNESDQGLLIKESTFVAATMHALFAADKMNVAALGNIVPQLHLHHIVRRTTDQAWPQPVWGRVGRLDYDAETLATMVVKLRAAFRLP